MTEAVFLYAIAIFLLIASFMIHAELLRHASDLVGWLNLKPVMRRHRFRHLPLGLATTICLFAHILEVWVFGIGFYTVVELLELGSFGGAVQAEGFLDYLYFSAVTYTSLGVGDLYPLGHLRLLAGIEALVGLILIGWTAAFTFQSLTKNKEQAHA